METLILSKQSEMIVRLPDTVGLINMEGIIEKQVVQEGMYMAV